MLDSISSPITRRVYKASQANFRLGFDNSSQMPFQKTVSGRIKQFLVHHPGAIADTVNQKPIHC